MIIDDVPLSLLSLSSNFMWSVSEWDIEFVVNFRTNLKHISFLLGHCSGVVVELPAD